jgi:hypothetical protein
LHTEDNIIMDFVEVSYDAAGWIHLG